MQLDPELTWLLRAAFGAELDSAPVDQLRAVELARTLQISGRVGRQLELSQTGATASALRAELGADFHTNVATEALLVRAQGEIAALGERLGVPVVALKFAALRAARISAPGTRQVSDLDLLVPKGSARFFGTH